MDLHEPTDEQYAAISPFTGEVRGVLTVTDPHEPYGAGNGSRALPTSVPNSRLCPWPDQKEHPVTLQKDQTSGGGGAAHRVAADHRRRRGRRSHRRRFHSSSRAVS